VDANNKAVCTCKSGYFGNGIACSALPADVQILVSLVWVRDGKDGDCSKGGEVGGREVVMAITTGVKSTRKRG
jgi:hypothetical protein